jgi:hypothetical protein
MFKKFAIAVVGTSALVLSAPVLAKGCVRGAIAGGIAGHYAGHHAVMGAMGGCAAGHMYYKHKARVAQGSASSHSSRLHRRAG